MRHRRMTITIGEKTYPRLQTVAKQHNRSMSNLIDILVNAEYDRVNTKGKPIDAIIDKDSKIREKIDQLPKL